MFDCQSSFSAVLDEAYPEPFANAHQDKSLRECCVQEPHFPQYFVSPGLGPSDHKIMGLMTPSPFKRSVSSSPQHQDSFCESLEVPDSSSQKCISHILDFNQCFSPRQTLTDLDTEMRTPKIEKKNFKGLRTLSESVYEIVLQLKVTTYKEVATQLVESLYENAQTGELGAREEQNIKRRVYDALNVLISASVLRRDGKEVRTEEGAIPEKMRQRQDIAGRETYRKLGEEMLCKRRCIEEKRQKLIELRNREEVLRAVLRRNRRKRFHKQSRIRLPAIGLIQDSCEAKTSYKPNHVEISTGKMNEVVGDVDMMMSIDMTGYNLEEIMDAEIFEDELAFSSFSP